MLSSVTVWFSIFCVSLYSLRVFYHQPQLLAFWSLSDSNFPQVTRTLLSILADISKAVVRMLSIFPLISYSTNFWNYFKSSNYKWYHHHSHVSQFLSSRKVQVFFPLLLLLLLIVEVVVLFFSLFDTFCNCDTFFFSTYFFLYPKINSSHQFFICSLIHFPSYFLHTQYSFLYYLSPCFILFLLLLFFLVLLSCRLSFILCHSFVSSIIPIFFWSFNILPSISPLLSSSLFSYFSGLFIIFLEPNHEYLSYLFLFFFLLSSFI